MQIRNFFNKSSDRWEKIGCKFVIFTAAIYSLLDSLVCYAAEGDDDLKDVMTGVTKDFGSDSTFVKLLYLAEILAGVYAYHKTKNIPVLLGIVVISLFLNFALKHFVFTPA